MWGARSSRVVMMGKRTIPSSSFYIYRDKGTEAGEEPGSLRIWARSTTTTTISRVGRKEGLLDRDDELRIDTPPGGEQ